MQLTSKLELRQQRELFDGNHSNVCRLRPRVSTRRYRLSRESCVPRLARSILREQGNNRARCWSTVSTPQILQAEISGYICRLTPSNPCRSFSILTPRSTERLRVA